MIRPASRGTPLQPSKYGTSNARVLILGEIIPRLGQYKKYARAILPVTGTCRLKKSSATIHHMGDYSHSRILYLSTTPKSIIDPASSIKHPSDQKS